MADHLVYGKHADTGTSVHYTDENGTKHEATVKRLEPVYHADLQARLDGTDRFLQHVPFNETPGVPGTWSHVVEDTPTVEESTPLVDTEAAIDTEPKKRKA